MKYQFLGFYSDTWEVFHHEVNAETHDDALRQLGLEFTADLNIIAVECRGSFTTRRYVTPLDDLLEEAEIHISEHDIMEHLASDSTVQE